MLEEAVFELLVSSVPLPFVLLADEVAVPTSSALVFTSFESSELAPAFPVCIVVVVALLPLGVSAATVTAEVVAVDVADVPVSSASEIPGILPVSIPMSVSALNVFRNPFRCFFPKNLKERRYISEDVVNKTNNHRRKCLCRARCRLFGRSPRLHAYHGDNILYR